MRRHNGIRNRKMSWKFNNAYQTALCGSALALALVAPAARAAGSPNDPVKNNDVTLPHVAADRTGSVPTKDTATLHLTTDLGSVRVMTLPPGAAAEVRYAVHIETDARSPLAEHLLDRYGLVTRAVADGVEIT